MVFWRHLQRLCFRNHGLKLLKQNLKRKIVTHVIQPASMFESTSAFPSLREITGWVKDENIFRKQRSFVIYRVIVKGEVSDKEKSQLSFGNILSILSATSSTLDEIIFSYSTESSHVAQTPSSLMTFQFSSV